MIAIVTDSVCDLPENIIQQLGIEVVPAYITVGKESWLDGVDITRQEFYELLPNMNPLPTTASPAPGEFKVRYEALLNKASHIISIHAAGQLSGIVEAARIAAQLVSPEKITVIDSGQLSMGFGWAVKSAAEAVRNCETVEVVLNCVRRTLKQVRVYAVFDTLEYLARSGRVNIIQLGLGTLLNLKPMVALKDGEIHTLGRIRTWSRAVLTLTEHICSHGPIEKLAILHTNHADNAEKLCKHMVALVEPVESMVVDVTSVIGVHTGPRAIGVAIVLRHT